MLHHHIIRSFNRWIVYALIAALCLLLGMNAAGAEETAELAFRRLGVPVQGTVTVYREANRKSGEVTRIEPEEQCEIIGSADNYYHIRLGEHTGFVAKNKIRIETLPAKVEEALCTEVTLATSTPNRHTKYLTLQGIITAKEPLETLYAYV